MDVVVVGGCSVDLITFAQRKPYPGETCQGLFFDMVFSGKGANQCWQAAKLKGKTAMVAVLGNDFYADCILENFKTLEINTDMIRKEETGSSGVVSINVNKEGVISTVIIPGANMKMTEEDINKARDMIIRAKVVVCQLEVPQHVSLATLRMARKSEVFTILNTTPVLETVNPEIFKFCDIVCANRIEALQLTEILVTDVEKARTAAKLLLAKGSKCVIITMGEKGCVLTSAEYDGIHVTAPTREVADLTGVGDSFVGALAYFKALLPKLTLLETVRRATFIAARSTEIPGKQRSFPCDEQFHPEVMKKLEPLPDFE